ncbi:hypothetical protein KEM52_004400 [Ascosphaera acerosa]|nr:hypothetical protein KEM52_004400 [Ascosphaera acerosa]
MPAPLSMSFRSSLPVPVRTRGQAQFGEIIGRPREEEWERAATKRRACYGHEYGCSDRDGSFGYRASHDDPDSAWRSRASSQVTTPEGYPDAHYQQQQQVPLQSTLHGKKSAAGPANPYPDPDLDLTMTPEDACDLVFSPVTAAEGKRKRTLSQSASADGQGADDECGSAAAAAPPPASQAQANAPRGIETVDELQQHQAQQQQQQQIARFSLTSIMNTLLGGLPGKVWNFCCESTFRGFHAGGGKGYAMPASSGTATDMPVSLPKDEAQPLLEFNADTPTNADPALSHAECYPSPAGTPGQPRMTDTSHLLSTSAARRRLTLSDTGPNGLSSPWIVVRPPCVAKTSSSESHHLEDRRLHLRTSSAAASITSAPAAQEFHHSSSHSPAAAPPPRKLPRRNTILVQPSLPITPRPRHRARASLAGGGRKRQTLSAGRTHLPLRSGGMSSPLGGPTTLSSPLHDRQYGRELTADSKDWEYDSSDYGSVPGVGVLPSDHARSPASLEAQRLAAQLRRRERQEDADLRRLNRRLKAMIKEGQEALGTRIEIEDGFEDCS